VASNEELRLSRWWPQTWMQGKHMTETRCGRITVARHGRRGVPSYRRRLMQDQTERRGSVWHCGYLARPGLWAGVPQDPGSRHATANGMTLAGWKSSARRLQPRPPCALLLWFQARGLERWSAVGPVLLRRGAAGSSICMPRRACTSDLVSRTAPAPHRRRIPISSADTLATLNAVDPSQADSVP
jgi:hypothetical protein